MVTNIMWAQRFSCAHMKRSATFLTISSVALSMLAWEGAISHAWAEDASFAGKTINITIGFAAGGGVDLYGRTLGRHMAHYLPGAPTVVVVNQPGAGGVVALNEWSKRVDPSGLNVTIGAQSQTDPDALNRTHAKFSPID